MNVKIVLPKEELVITKLDFDQLADYFQIPNQVYLEDIIHCEYSYQNLNIDLYSAFVKIALYIQTIFDDLTIAQMILKDPNKTKIFNKLILNNYLMFKNLNYIIYEPNLITIVSKEKLNETTRELTDYALIPTTTKVI